jgi:transcriptional regulator with XRE-family HTH domain
MPDELAELPTEGQSLAARLNWLFDRVRRHDGKIFTLREVADAVTAAGESISHAYIAQLRRGQKTDPTIGHLRGLARFFAVPVEYFTSDRVAREVGTELATMAALQDLRAQTVAMRESIIPDAESALQAMTQLLAMVRDLESRPGDADGSR